MKRLKEAILAAARVNLVEKVSEADMSTFTRGWPDASLVQADEIVKKYGNPDEGTGRMLIWYNNGVWSRTIVHRDPVQHNWPAPHLDLLEQSISYKVPVGMYSDIAKYDGSVFTERTKGEMAARCHFESMNFVALNLANDLVTKKKNIREARKEYERLFKIVVIEKPDVLPAEARKLAFKTQPLKRARDLDIQTVGV